MPYPELGLSPNAHKVLSIDFAYISGFGPLVGPCLKITEPDNVPFSTGVGTIPLRASCTSLIDLYYPPACRRANSISAARS